MEKNEIIDSYSQLSLSDKRKELGRELAEITLVTEKLLNDIDSEYTMKSMDEFTNLFEDATSEDEYLTGLYEDLIELKETMGTYYSFVTELYYNFDNNE